jgi:hypothetical protein
MAFNKTVHLHSFQVGDLVLAVKRSNIVGHKLKILTTKWDSSYVVQEIYSNGSYKIVAEDGLRIGLINDKYLK